VSVCMSSMDARRHARAGVWAFGSQGRMKKILQIRKPGLHAAPVGSHAQTRVLLTYSCPDTERILGYIEPSHGLFVVADKVVRWKYVQQPNVQSGFPQADRGRLALLQHLR
jgi:hypothetical protein